MSTQALLSQVPSGSRAALALSVARAVDSIPGVLRSPDRRYATLHAGGRVEGVQLGTVVEVHVLASPELYGRSLLSVGDDITRAVTASLRASGDPRVVHVTIDGLSGDDSAHDGGVA